MLVCPYADIVCSITKGVDTTSHSDSKATISHDFFFLSLSLSLFLVVNTQEVRKALLQSRTGPNGVTFSAELAVNFVLDFLCFFLS